MKLIILDRDGVINADSPDFIKSADEWQPIEGSLEAIARLNQAGWTVVVATNQSGLARGLFDEAALLAMHDKMRHLLEAHGGKVDSIFHCPHGPWHGCECRKPKAGLFEQIGQHYQIALHSVPAVGDSLRDIQAAVSVGAQPYLVKTGKGETTLAKHPELAQIPVATNLAHVVDRLLAQS